MKKYAGFTLIELIMTLIIVGILAAIGVPSLRNFMKSNKLIAATNELVSAIHIARSEAIKLNSKVSICESSNGSTCTTTGDWQSGWIVFIDANGDLANTGAACAGKTTDCLLRIHSSFNDNQLTIKGVDTNKSAIHSFTFTSRGLPKDTTGASQSGVFSLCSMDSTGKTVDSRAVVLSLSGRVRASNNAAVISCP